jgi:hypothetical protein
MCSVNCTNNAVSKKSLRRRTRGRKLGLGSLIWLGFCLSIFSFPALAQSQQTPVAASGGTGAPGAQQSGTPAGAQASDQQTPGTITGTVVDQSGSIMVGAHVQLTNQGAPAGSAGREVVTDDNGQFTLTGVAPGNYQVSISAESLTTQVVSVIVHSGEAVAVPQVALPVATQVTQVVVGITRVEQAEVQIQDQEKQRVLGIIPNYYVSYVPNALALTSKQKFELAWKSSIDPVTFVAVGILAGAQQAADEFHGYGQGAQGYGKRYGADYGDVVLGTFVGSAILPALLKQDPRYFYKGTGSTRSRVLYALASPFFCKGDNGHWQANYSYVVGNFAAAGIANFYYPAKDQGGRLVAENALVRISANSISAVFQEFVVRKLTPHLPARPTSTP